MTLDTTRFLEDLTSYRARTYRARLSALMSARARREEADATRARLRLAETIRATMGTAELIGALRVLRRAARGAERMNLRAASLERRRILLFAESNPEQTLLPNVTFEEAARELVERVPVVLRPAAERTAENIARLYSERRIVAFAHAADEAVTRRVKELIIEGVREGGTEREVGRAIAAGAQDVGASAENWTEAYSRLVFRTNVNTAATAGRFRMVQDPDVEGLVPAFRFVSADDSDTRDNHRAGHGVVLKVTNREWNRVASPLGYNCRCDLEEMDIITLEDFGLLRDGEVVESSIPSGWFPDPGFRHAGRPDLFIAGLGVA